MSTLYTLCIYFSKEQFHEKHNSWNVVCVLIEIFFYIPTALQRSLPWLNFVLYLFTNCKKLHCDTNIKPQFLGINTWFF